ncbi:hypothetical protein ACWEVP_22570 [Amycolatopsis sp. NPDC003865]
MNRIFAGRRKKPAGWAAPELLAGRGSLGLLAAGLLILVGALTDTAAFKAVLDLLLNEAEVFSWLMALGATALALMAAATAGVALAGLRHGRTGVVPAIVVLTIAWLALGVVLLVVRWHSAELTGSALGFGAGAGPDAAKVERGHYAAWFFFALYLVSGLCTAFEAERLYNPVYFAHRRFVKQTAQQSAEVARLDALKVRADSVVDQCVGEFDREDERMTAAIRERQALGAELANYARHLMAVHMQDPAKTGVTETGPVPLPSSSPAAEPEEDGDEEIRRAG